MDLEEIYTYIESHLEGEITLTGMADALCYSEEYLCRFFKKNTGRTLFDCIREKRLLQAARTLKARKGKIVDVAFNHGFDSHEGFTRAFSSYFGISPLQFRKYKPEIKDFMPRGLKALPVEGRELTMDTLTIFTQIVERPERKLYLLRAGKAQDYFAYCEEVGCDIWGRLLQVKDPIFEPVGLWMPDKFRPEGTSLYVQGVEVPGDYPGDVPEGLECQILPPCTYMVFHSEPYECDDDTMMKVIGQVWKAIENYRPETYGYQWAPEAGPRFQAAPLAERGYIEGRPVVKI